MLDLKIFTDMVEPEALNQIYTLAKQPAFSGCKIRIMPDVHAGMGCVIGFTADLGDKVIPNIVGSDIGCGMRCVKLEEEEMDFAELDRVIRSDITAGGKDTKTKKCEAVQELYCYSQLKDLDGIERNFGTLGGGNHFIEVDVDDAGNHYLIIHTGSRTLGKQVAQYYQNKAIQLRQEDTSFSGVPKDLSYLTGDEREAYLHDMRICQEYAVKNREEIARIITEKGKMHVISQFETVHNYVEVSTNMIRKGAISAKAGEQILIPMNMRDGCLLCRGKGNDDWNQSAPHGAGRLMKRSQAKEQIRMDEYEEAMKGIYTTSVSRGTLDESPMAYKPMEMILPYLGETADVEDLLKPVYNFKAGR